MPSPDQDALMSCVERGGGRGRFSLAPTAIRRVNTPHPQRNLETKPGPTRTPLPPPPPPAAWPAGRRVAGDPGSASGANLPRLNLPSREAVCHRLGLRSGRGSSRSSLSPRSARRPAARARFSLRAFRIGRHRMIALRFSVVSAFSPRGSGNDNETRSLVPATTRARGPRARAPAARGPRA